MTSTKVAGERSHHRVMTLACCVVLGVAFSPSSDGRAAVKSLMEMRQDRVVIQQWDLSCGAAALATLLTYQHSDPVSEKEIARQLISREEYIENPLLVRARNGFSLMDLKRYVDERGYEGVGYGKLSFEDLADLAPTIVPIQLHGYPHFVVFRGALGNRVLLADPAFGNHTMLTANFESIWFEYPRFGKVGFIVKRLDGAEPPNQLAPRPTDFMSLQ
jgi:uncharacterized protein